MRSRSTRLFWRTCPPSPAEGPLYGIQMHMNLLDLYQNLKQTSGAQEQLAIAQKQIAALDEQGAGRAQFLRLRATIAMHGNNLDSAQKDVKELLAINGKDPNNLQLDGDLLMKAGTAPTRPSKPMGRFWRRIRRTGSRSSRLVMLSRAAGQRPGGGEVLSAVGRCLPQVVCAVPGAGRPVHGAARLPQSARRPTSKAYALAPHNAQIVAGGMNAAIEAHTLDVAGVVVQPDHQRHASTSRR